MTLPRLIALLSAAAAGLPGAAFAFCGDAAPDPGETCDDGNNDAADGCSPACVIEYGYTCDLPTGTLSGVGVNLSFESDDATSWDSTDLVPGNQVANSLTPTGWTIGPNPVDILLNGAAGTVMQDGGQAVRLAGVLGPAYIEQNIPVPADRQYRISYSWARSAVDCRFNNEVGITVTVESADRDGDDADFDAQRTQLGTDELVWPTGSVSVRAHSGSIRMLVSGSSGVATYCGPVFDDIEITRASTCDPIDSDGDSLTDLEEDLDGDGQVDAGESDPNDEDSDDDGLSDFTETRGTGLLAEFGAPTPPTPTPTVTASTTARRSARRSPRAATLIRPPSTPTPTPPPPPTRSTTTVTMTVCSTARRTATAMAAASPPRPTRTTPTPTATSSRTARSAGAPRPRARTPTPRSSSATTTSAAPTPTRSTPTPTAAASPTAKRTSITTAASTPARPTPPIRSMTTLTVTA
jgi:cysteine-rich repeat protein